MVSRKIELNTQLDINDLIYTNYDMIVGVGGKRYDVGILFSSPDNGQTWSAIDSVSNKAIYSLKQMPDGELMMCDFEGSIKQSKDSLQSLQNYWGPDLRVMQDITAATATNWFVVTANTLSGGYVYNLKDKAASWEVVENNFGVYSIEFMNATEGCFAGYGAMKYTKDAGITWSFADPKNDLFCDLCKTDNYLYATGRYGTFWCSANAGKDWKQLLQKHSKYVGDHLLYRSVFLDNQNGFLLGSEGLLLKTDDGGESWVKIHPFTEKDLKSACYINANTLFVGTLQGELYELNF